MLISSMYALTHAQGMRRAINSRVSTVGGAAGCKIYLLQKFLKFVCPTSLRLMITREVIIAGLQQNHLFQPGTESAPRSACRSSTPPEIAPHTGTCANIFLCEAYKVTGMSKHAKGLDKT